jgi:SAM-dependent methyltransferase
MAAYERYSPIHPGQQVLEVGCGVGRDAIPLAKLVGPGGSYVGVDISLPSIQWCRDNITPQLPNATFEHLDIRSDLYNPTGALTASGTSLPARDRQFDRIILQSVFTHMFEDDIVHFLSEFRRVLRPSGVVFASFFVLGAESIRLILNRVGALTFLHPLTDGCRIHDPQNPEGAVGYTPDAVDRMLRATGLVLDQPIHHGSWSGRQNVPDGQDIVIMRRARIPTRLLGRLRGAISRPTWREDETCS